MFNFKQHAFDLGNYLDVFATLAKNFNNGMVRREDTRGLIDRIVGSGPFNRAVLEPPTDSTRGIQEDTVLYGEKLIRARSQQDGEHHGLFAALGGIHHPLLGFAQNLMIDLGKKGYRFVIPVDGKDVIVPLHMVRVTFNEQNHVLTNSAVTQNDITIPEGFILAKNTYADAGGNYKVRNTNAKIFCRIIDTEGRPLESDMLIKLLWLGIAGQGKNKYAVGSKKESVLVKNGVDDMALANDYLVEAVEGLQASYGYDPEPLWNQIINSSREKIRPYLAEMALARECIENSTRTGNVPAIMSGPISLPHPEVTADKHWASTYKVNAIDNVTGFFGLTLPELTPQDRQTAHTLSQGLAAVRA